MNQSITLPAMPDTRAEQAYGVELRQQADAVSIVDSATFAQAADLLKNVNMLRKRIEEHYEPIKSAAHAAHKAAVAACNEHLKPVSEVEQVLKRKCGEWQRVEAERIAKLRAEEEERQRAEAAELAKKEAEARKLLEDQRIALAEKLQASGQTEKAQAALAAPVVVPDWMKPAPSAPREIVTAPKVDGVGLSLKWKASITDKLALVKHVAAHPELLHLLDANMPALNGMARSMKEGFEMPGVIAVSEASTTVRS